MTLTFLAFAQSVTNAQCDRLTSSLSLASSIAHLAKYIFVIMPCYNLDLCENNSTTTLLFVSQLSTALFKFIFCNIMRTNLT